MKFNYLLTFFSVCFMTLLQSCRCEQEPEIYGTNESVATISHMVVKFEDKIYKTDVKTMGDSVVYLNHEYAELYRSKIAVLPSLATVMASEDGIIYVEYLGSKKEVEETFHLMTLQNETRGTDNISTRGNVIDLTPPNDGSITLSIAELYDDKNCKDTMLKSYLTSKTASCSPYLTGLGFNDKCSSIKVFNYMDPTTYYSIYFKNEVTGTIHQNIHSGKNLRPVLVSYENSNYGGKVLYCIGPVSGSDDVHIDSNLKTIGWNDKISAISWLLVYDFNLFTNVNGEDPKIPAHLPC